MIANGLIFLFGVFLAALIALLLTPLVWRKAQRLARREFEATIPVSANEIRAEFDRVRAEAAVTVRRQEVLTARALERLAKTQAELGRSTVEGTGLLKRGRGLSQSLADREAELAGIQAVLSEGDERRRQLETELTAARHDGDLKAQELEALARRFQDVSEIAEERQIQLVAGDAKFDRVSDSLRAGERAGRDMQAAIERLRLDNARLDQALKDERAKKPGLGGELADLAAGLPDYAGPDHPEPDRDAAADGAAGSRSDREEREPSPQPQGGGIPRPDGQGRNGGWEDRRLAARRPGPAAGSASDEAEIRERIAEIAARVIRMTAAAEGPGSPIPALLSGSREPDGGPAENGNQRVRPSGAPSLADRVRLLAEAEGRQGELGDPEDQETGPRA